MTSFDGFILYAFVRYHAKVIIHRLFVLRKGFNEIFSIKCAQLASDVRENDFRYLIDGISQQSEDIQPVEILNIPKIAILDYDFRIQTTAARDLIEDGVLEQGAEGILPRRFV